MFKTFSTGVILGVLAAGAAAQFVPLADLHREASIVTMQPNGGNAELFRINLATDRIMAGSGTLSTPTPDGLAWPDSEALSDTEVELFKMRNADDRVVGVASRIAAAGDGGRDVSEWALYLPARGTLYVTMAAAAEDGRIGTLRAGTREFAMRRGTVTERYVAGGAGADGRIELRAFLVSTEVEDEAGAAP